MSSSGMSIRLFARVIAAARASLFSLSAKATMLVEVSAVTAAIDSARILFFMIKPPLII